MDVKNLWSTLKPLSHNIETIKKDYERGITPYLPYFVIGQEDLKTDIRNKIQEIDTERLKTTLILGEYGNGKTNILDYLKLYFRYYQSEDSKVLITKHNANVDNPDIVLTLLYHLEIDLIDDLVVSFKQINEDSESKKIYDDLLTDNLRPISEYVQTFQNQKDDIDIRALVYLGTGRLYTKAEWKNYGLTQMRDYQRREILCFFLNVLALCKKYVIFEIDEIEKIREKSKVRFFRYLTSFRELLDLAKHINGHLLLVAMTVASKRESNSVINENPAFATRIANDIQLIDFINEEGQQKDLIDIICKLLEFDKEITKISGQLSRRMKKVAKKNNRELLKELFKVINKIDGDTEQKFDLVNELKKAKLNDLFQNTKTDLEEREVFKSIDKKIFYPLSIYLENKRYSDLSYNLDIRDKVLIVPEESKLIVWNFTENTVSNDFEKCLAIKDSYSTIILMKSSDYDLHSNHVIYKGDLVDVYEFDPKTLMTLLEMYNRYSGDRNELDYMIVNYLQGVIT